MEAANIDHTHGVQSKISALSIEVYTKRSYYIRSWYFFKVNGLTKLNLNTLLTPCLSFACCYMIKQPNKSNLKEKGFIWLRISECCSLLFWGSQSGSHVKQQSHDKSHSKAESNNCMHAMLSLLSPLSYKSRPPFPPKGMVLPKVGEPLPFNQYYQNNTQHTRPQANPICVIPIKTPFTVTLDCLTLATLTITLS